MSGYSWLHRAGLWALIGGIFISGCTAGQVSSHVSSPPSNPNRSGDEEITLTIFAAASLAEAFDEIIGQFEAAYPGVKVSANYAGSQQLAQQLAQGAPADVFASANEQQMDAAISSGRVYEQKIRPLAENKMAAIFYTGGEPARFELADLAKAGLKLALADQRVPIGQYTLEFLDKAARQPALGANFKQRVLANVVSYEENVRAVLAKVSLGEADAGIVYQSDLHDDQASHVQLVEIPETLNVTAKYLIAPTQDSHYPEMAQTLVNYLLSPAGQEILSKHGFQPAR